MTSINVKEIKPGTLIKLKKLPAIYQRSFDDLDLNNNNEMSFEFWNNEESRKQNEDLIVMALQYKESLVNIKIPKYQGSWQLYNHKRFDSYKGFLFLLQILHNNKKFWIIVRESQQYICDLPDDFFEQLRNCDWIEYLKENNNL